jgi:ADP-ribose pyrophosphatase
MRGDELMSWPVRSRTVLGEGRISAFVDEEVETPSGEVMTRQYLTHPGAVAVVAWREDTDEIAVLRQYRHPVRMELVELPAGLLDNDGEDWCLAAQRELAEEVELMAERWDVLVDTCTTPGACEESLRIYLARDIAPAARPEGFVLEDEEAHMSWSWVPRAQLVDAVLDGAVQNPSLVSGILALEVARVHGRLDSLRPATADWPIRR